MRPLQKRYPYSYLVLLLRASLYHMSERFINLSILSICILQIPHQK